MTYYRTNIIASEVFSDATLSDGALAYLEARAKNAFYDYVITKFKEAEQSSSLTKAKLARRLNKTPDQISHILGAPGNWTIGTISCLLLGISREELVPHSVSFLNRPPGNIRSIDLLAEAGDKWGIHQSPPQTGTQPLPPLSGLQWNAA